MQDIFQDYRIPRNPYPSSHSRGQATHLHLVGAYSKRVWHRQVPSLVIRDLLDEMIVGDREVVRKDDDTPRLMFDLFGGDPKQRVKPSKLSYRVVYGLFGLSRTSLGQSPGPAGMHLSTTLEGLLGKGCNVWSFSLFFLLGLKELRQLRCLQTLFTWGKLFFCLLSAAIIAVHARHRLLQSHTCGPRQ